MMMMVTEGPSTEAGRAQQEVSLHPTDPVKATLAFNRDKATFFTHSAVQS